MSGLLDFLIPRKNKEDFSKLYNKIHSIEYIKSKFDDAEVYWLHKPFAKAVIKETYEVVEPEIKPDEILFLEKVYAKIRDRLILKNINDLQNKELTLFKEFAEEIKKSKVDDTTAGRIWYYLRRDLIGYGKIDALLKDSHIEDISCSGYNLPVYVYHRAHGSLRTNIRFREGELDSFVLKLAQRANSQVSLEKPIADSTLPTGERIQVTYRSIVSTRGSTFSIRKVSEEPITPLDLIAWNTLNSKIAALLWLCVDAGMNILITGSTASGKTTMLNALSLFIPFRVKVISIEDTREVRLPHENWTPFLAKDSDDMFELLKASLRQRPEYLIVGEVRGKEAITMFQAMNTGHTTYSTLHAGDAVSAINRLVHEPINVPIAMFDALDLLMVLKIEYVKGKMVRRLNKLYTVELKKGVEIQTTPVFSWNKNEDTYKELELDKLVERLSNIYGKKTSFVEDEVQTRAKFLENLLEERHKMDTLVDTFESYRRTFYEKL